MPALNNAPLLMTDTLPLRRAADVPKYRADAAERYLPWVFGQATLSAVPLDKEGAEWLVADHPISGVTKVVAENKVVTGWQLQQRVDATGQPVSVVRLAQPSINGPVFATVVGRKHPVTGAALSSPRSIVREIMRLCNHVEQPSAWEGLDDSYGQVALGIVFDSPQLLRVAIASVIEPLYAVWRPGWAARRKPGMPIATLDPQNTDSITARMDNTTLATAARVSYAFDWAAGASRGTLLLGAPAAQEQWGRVVKDLSLPGVIRARDALEFASAQLADAARITWIVTATVDARIGQVLAGQTVQLAHPHAPAGPALVTAVSHNRESATLTITAELHTESAPSVELQRRNGAIDPAGPAETTTNYRDGVATFTIYDEQGNPLANATVTLDGIYAADSDAAGKVQFKTPRGPHTLTIRMPGYATFEMDVDV